MDDFLQGTRLAFRRQHRLETKGLSFSHVGADQALLRLARRHRVVSLWAAAGILPWQEPARAQIVHTVRAAHQAAVILPALQRLDPNACLIKGPALAVQAWPEPGLRDYDDLDFRCQHISFPLLAPVFESLGFLPEGGDRDRSHLLWQHGWGLGFIGPQGLRVECNWRWFPPQYPQLRLPVGAADSLTRLHIDGAWLQAPKPDVHLLYGCMHLIWHNWARMSWLVDIAGLLVRHPEALLSARRLAGSRGFGRCALEAGCAAAERLFGPLPVADPAWSERRHADAQAISKQLTAADGGQDGQARERIAHQRGMSPRERMRYSARRVFIPGDADYLRWPLSARWHHLYWGLRPMRLIERYVRHCR